MSKSKGLSPATEETADLVGAVDAMDAAIYRLKGFAAILNTLADAQKSCDHAPVHEGDFWIGLQELSDVMFADLKVVVAGVDAMDRAKGGAR